jgi:TfoX/Sxy family transcriptional regulator of competence genes
LGWAAAQSPIVRLHHTLTEAPHGCKAQAHDRRTNLVRKREPDARRSCQTLGFSIMAFDPELARRVREVLGDRPGITERKMFRGMAFLVGGKMFVGIRNSSLMARVGSERHQDALAMPGVRVMDFTGRPMKGYVYIDPPAIAAQRDLKAWILWCTEYVARLPEKRSK